MAFLVVAPTIGCRGPNYPGIKIFWRRSKAMRGVLLDIVANLLHAQLNLDTSLRLACQETVDLAGTLMCATPK
jgi:hypothetical protein